MKKNTLLILSLSIILSVSVLLGFFFWPSSHNLTKIINFIPSDALLIVESKQMHTLVDVNGKQNSYVQFLFKNKIGEELIQFDSIFQYLPIYKNNNLASAFSVHEQEGSISCLFYLTFNKIKELNEQKKMLYQLLNGELTSKLLYENEKVEQLSLKHNSIKLYLWFYSNTLVSSTNIKLINRSIHQFHSKKTIDNDLSFASIRKTSGLNVIANVYLNLNSKSTIYDTNKYNHLTALWSNIQKNASWCALDFRAEDSILIFNGFSSYAQNNTQYLSVLANQTINPVEIDTLLPNATYKASIISLSSPDSFKTNYNRYLHKNNLLINHKQICASLDINFRFNISQYLYTQLNSSVAIFQQPSIDKTVNENYLILNLKSPNELINRFNEAHFPNIQIHLSNKEDVTCYTVPASDLSGTLFGPLFSSPTLINFTVWHNLFISSESYRNTERYINQLINNETLDKDYLWNEQKKTMSNKYIIKLFIRPEFDADTKSTNTKQKSTINKYAYNCLQFSPEDKLLYTNMIFQCKENKIAPNSKGSFGVYSTPQLLHKSWFANSFVAYNDTSVVLFNPKGEKTWSFSVHENPIGEIREIDAFNNGKYQLLFASQNTIYLIDKNGKSIPPFPLTLSSKTTGQVSWIKYSDSPEGRIFMPTENGVQSYSNKGEIVRGWNPPISSFPIKGEINYCSANGQDILYFHNGHEWFFTNRQGKAKAQWPKNITLPINPKLFLSTSPSKEICFIGTTQYGNFIQYQLNKPYTLLNNNNISQHHYFQQLINNKNTYYLLVDKNTFSLFDQKFKKQYEATFSDSICDFPDFFNFPVNEQFITFKSIKNKVYLFSFKTNSIKSINLDNPNSKFYLQSSSEGQVIWIDNRRLQVIKKSITKENL